MKYFVTAILLITTFFTGCQRVDPNAPTRPRLVVEVRAQYEGENIHLERCYIDDEKVRAVLDYIRSLDPYGTVAENSIVADEQAWIELIFSDGTTKCYHQYGAEYLRCGDGDWQNITKERGTELPVLLGMMESDKKF